MAIKYDNCKDCHSRCVHAGRDRKFVCINGVSCKITTGKPQTNFERIKNMSVEELAEFIDYGDECGFCNQFGVDTGRECDGDCVECIKHLLGVKTANNRPQTVQNRKD